MTGIRDFLLTHLGGTPLLWEVFLGAFLAIVLAGLLRFLIWFVASFFD